MSWYIYRVTTSSGQIRYLPSPTLDDRFDLAGTTESFRAAMAWIKQQEAKA